MSTTRKSEWRQKNTAGFVLNYSLQLLFFPHYHALILGQACLFLGLALAVAAMNLRMNDSRPVL